MYSTALKKTIAGTMLLLISSTCFALNKLPRILREPVLGLRYEVAKTRFEPLAASETAKCETNEHAASVWFVYSKHATNAGRTYYLTGGYTVWKHPEPGQQKYEADRLGGVFYIEGEKCVYLDEARQTFIDRIVNEEMDLAILQGLAADYAVRLQNAFGGADRVRREIRQQRTDLDDLPPEIGEALKPIVALMPAK